MTDGREREGRWRRLHKPQANAGPEFDGCLEVMDQASVFLLSRHLRHHGGPIMCPPGRGLGLVMCSGPCRLVWAETAAGSTHVFKYLCTDLA